uniref:Cherp_1 protein n=1 Tax=Fopius arisanus TaxID=64838 RepID=A0A0C9RGE3_9HYME
MDQAPSDNELRKIIDKLAQFVARNGPEFEQMTKNKQKDNPKFSFLFGGDYFNYYQYKVTTEQASKSIKKNKVTKNSISLLDSEIFNEKSDKQQVHLFLFTKVFEKMNFS